MYIYVYIIFCIYMHRLNVTYILCVYMYVYIRRHGQRDGRAPGVQRSLKMMKRRLETSAMTSLCFCTCHEVSWHPPEDEFEEIEVEAVFLP